MVYGMDNGIEPFAAVPIVTKVGCWFKQSDFSEHIPQLLVAKTD